METKSNEMNFIRIQYHVCVLRPPPLPRAPCLCWYRRVNLLHDDATLHRTTKDRRYLTASQWR